MERITKLAQPKSHKMYKSLFLKEIQAINPAALKYKASQRIEELSLPKKNFGPEIDRHNTKSSSVSITPSWGTSKRTTVSSDSNRNVRKSKK